MYCLFFSIVESAILEKVDGHGAPCVSNCMDADAPRKACLVQPDC